MGSFRVSLENRNSVNAKKGNTNGAFAKQHFNNTLSALRDASVQPLVNLFKFMNSPKGIDLVKMVSLVFSQLYRMLTSLQGMAQE